MDEVPLGQVTEVVLRVELQLEVAGGCRVGNEGLPLGQAAREEVTEPALAAHAPWTVTRGLGLHPVTGEVILAGRNDHSLGNLEGLVETLVLGRHVGLQVLPGLRLHVEGRREDAPGLGLTGEIRSIAREPGHRAKVAVSAAQQGIDPVGACVGIRGVRIQTIVRELHDEKIDVIEWNSNPAVFIAKAISPARVSGVYLETEMKGNKTATVVVPEDQLSLAIGRQGQNARLAAKLTGWRIDIMSLTEATGKALLKLKENSSYAEMVESETENMLKIEDLLQKKAEGRPLPPEDYKFMSRFVDRIEKRGEAERKAEQDAEQARIAEIKTTIPKLAYEIPILDIELKRNVLEILRDAGIENLGDLIMQTRLDSDTILALNGIGPKTLERIIDFVENIKLPEESEQPDLVSISEAEQAEVSGELSQGKVLETEPEKGASVEIKQDEQLEQVELESAAVESSKSEVVETGKEATTEEVPFEDLFKVDPKKFDFYPEGESSADDEGSELTPAKKKGKKSKRGFTVVEYDPDKDQTIVRRKRKRDDGWEEW